MRIRLDPSVKAALCKRKIALRSPIGIPRVTPVLPRSRWESGAPGGAEQPQTTCLGKEHQQDRGVKSWSYSAGGEGELGWTEPRVERAEARHGSRRWGRRNPLYQRSPTHRPPRTPR